MGKKKTSGRYTPRQVKRTRTVDSVAETLAVETIEDGDSITVTDPKKLMLAIGRGESDGEKLDIEERRLAAAVWAEAMEPGFAKHATPGDLDFLIEAQFTALMERDGRFRGQQL